MDSSELSSDRERQKKWIDKIVAKDGKLANDLRPLFRREVGSTWKEYVADHR
jgi:methylphosphotriester-DNA--protein-cysteine methyltransferase